MDNDAFKVFLCCPGCGFDIFYREDKRFFICSSCGDRLLLKDLVFLIEPISYDFD